MVFSNLDGPKGNLKQDRGIQIRHFHFPEVTGASPTVCRVQFTAVYKAYLGNIQKPPSCTYRELCILGCAVITGDSAYSLDNQGCSTIIRIIAYRL